LERRHNSQASFLLPFNKKVVRFIEKRSDCTVSR
jgi:hypothetical protein